jgi:hypothetical protein
MTYTCEYCNLILKTSISLLKHKETNKKCIKLQNKHLEKNIKQEEFICEFCDKKFVSKQSKNNHLKTSYCKNIYEKELKIKEYKKQAEIDLELNNKQKDEITRLENENTELRKEIKDNETEMKHLKSELESMKDIVLKSVSAPKTINNQQNNKYTFLSPFDLTKEEIKEKIEQNFTTEYFLNGQKGVAQFTYNNLLFDDDNRIRYYCNDTSRKFFTFIDNTGKYVKDIKSKILTDKIANDIILKSQNICSSIVNDENVKLDIKIKYCGNMADISKLNDNNNVFVLNLAELTCNVFDSENQEIHKIEEIKDEDENHVYIIESDSENEEEKEDISKYTEEYFIEQYKILECLDKESCYYGYFKKNLDEKKEKYCKAH